MPGMIAPANAARNTHYPDEKYRKANKDQSPFLHQTRRKVD